MSDRYPVAELTDLPEDLRERILAEQEKAGFVPEVFLMFGRRPAEWRAFFSTTTPSWTARARICPRPTRR